LAALCEDAGWSDFLPHPELTKTRITKLITTKLGFILEFLVRAQFGT